MDKNIITFLDETDLGQPKTMFIPLENIGAAYKTQEVEKGAKIYLIYISEITSKTKKVQKPYRVCFRSRERCDEAYRQIREILNPVSVMVTGGFQFLAPDEK
jgi:hypothetical protein